eukprot:CAMPEP_0177539270 /NCGR_PEP_ID=MMETSP0369-20130122/58871_1 /TAXON_ID=447022 ORGANISM="Scrippsiella hangoei-like, Strain SHHI-4" /NCGR_SAMPLE_ID=MMETSP0369 /ASSEMBLY_ACC=CAM_ASM_000364 /LENGTH=50 /DNA_ID=CAMNT_0019022237 /DNA_START=99 /DNA_END=247 /DNA_ORIENTATION=-
MSSKWRATPPRTAGDGLAAVAGAILVILPMRGGHKVARTKGNIMPPRRSS